MDLLSMEQQEMIVEKEQEYMNDIVQHVQNVRKAVEEVIRKLHLPLDLSDQLRGRSLYHDESKYSDEEFDAYRKHFYSINDQEKASAEEEFQAALEHHYMVNTHHWNHYYNKKNNTAEPMPDADIYEMLADWTAMGYKFGNDAYTWYHGELEKDPGAIILHPETKQKVEESLEKLHTA